VSAITGPLGGAELVAFAATTNLDRARQFYEATLGLRLVSYQSPIACVFDANGTTLRVTAVPEKADAMYTVLGWTVADIAAAVRELSDRGIVFHRFDGMTQDDNGIWTTPGGDQVAWFSDPDGNTLSLTEEAG
jgi:catechol 2,3-dioxygenase-like lactoylglutathione lyase family enzyme